MNLADVFFVTRREKWPAANNRALLGKRISRVDGPLKSTGTAKYSFDINRPGMLWAKLVTSPHPRAEVVSIDTSAATAFVRQHPNASTDEIARGLGGNLCRCGTYAGMLLAVADAAKKGGA